MAWQKPSELVNQLFTHGLAGDLGHNFRKSLEHVLDYDRTGSYSFFNC